MKRSGSLKRGSGLARKAELSPYSKRRWDEVTAAGFRPTTSFRPKPREATTPKASPRRTDPKRSVCELVDKRSKGMCEWQGCPRLGVERHHRLNRKVGGRHGEMAELVNGAAWLLKVCKVHHAYVTSAYGEQLAEVRRKGWVLTERQNALRVPVLTRHDEHPIWLLPNGKFLFHEEACA